MSNVKKELKGNLTEDQLRRMKEEVSASMSRDRHSLLIHQPFVGSVAMRFDLVPVRDKRCRTACTDSKSIYMDINFYSSLSDKERKFVLAHEIWHSLSLTFARRQGRDPDLFNVASDMEINNILVGDGDENGAFEPPPDLMYPPPALKGKSAETLYEWLLRQQQKNNLNSALSSIPKPNSGRRCDDDGSSGGRSSGKKNRNGGGGGDEKRDDSKDGRKNGRLSGQFDDHKYAGEEPDAEKDGGTEISDQWGEVGYDEDFRPNIPKDAAERMKEAAVAAAQAYMREHGTLPAGVEGIVGKLTKPEISWREHLSQFVSRAVGGRRTYLPPARRHLYNDMYFQSRRNEKLRVGVFIDTSGSTSADLPKFFGELKGLVESFGSYEIHCIHCDASVDRYELYDENNPLDLEDATKIEYSGGGGTSFDPPFEYVKEHRLEIDCAVYMTDGFGPCTVGKPPYPVMWLVTKGGATDFCDWGVKVVFKESAWE